MKLWDAKGRVLYADDRASIGYDYRSSPRLRQTLGGRVAPGMSAADGADVEYGSKARVYEVIVPLRFGGGGTGDGTGGRILGALELPVDEIKIDRSFVMAMDREEQHARIVRSTIDLGRNLCLVVVAEDVESAEVWDRLVELGCDSAQGYYLAKPPEEPTRWLVERLPSSDLTAEVA